MSEYQGYTNAETFLVDHWLNNTERHHLKLRTIALNPNAGLADKCDALKAYVEEVAPAPDDNSLLNEMYTWALDAVDWREIIEGVEE